MEQKLHTPEGVRDIYSNECRAKLAVQDKLHQVLHLYGYQDIQTPTFEYFDVFRKEIGTISSRELYKFFDREGDTLALRPDITPSIARAAATLFETEDFPIRLCYVGSTFINHSSYQGRLKESTQLGAELIGIDSVEADAEMIAMVVDGLKKVGLKEFQVNIGHVDFLQSLMEATGLSKEQILEFVELIHKGKRVSFWWTMGVNQGYEAVRTAQAIINIALMTGNIGREGTGANSITGQCNAMGSRAYSNTAVLFGGGDFNNEKRRQQVAAALEVDESVLAEKPTITYNQIIEGINNGDIKGLWILCTNPMHSWTNNKTFQTAVEKLELFVVQDIYDDTDSAQACNVFLPVVPGIKKEGTYINLERRISAMRPCLEKEENEKNDYEVIYEIGKALGMGELLKNWETPKGAFKLMQKCSKGMPCDFTGTSWEKLENSHGVQWPFREGEVLEEDERRLYEDGNYFTPSKKAKFIFEEIRENPLPLTDEFPILLNTGRGTVGQWHTQTRTREVQFVEDVVADKAYVYMNTILAEENNIKENDKIRIYSINGKDAVFFVKITENVQYEELYAPIHYIECNMLTPSIYDPYSKEPSYKATPVRFEKLEVEADV